MRLAVLRYPASARSSYPGRAAMPPTRGSAGRAGQRRRQGVPPVAAAHLSGNSRKANGENGRRRSGYQICGT